MHFFIRSTIVTHPEGPNAGQIQILTRLITNRFVCAHYTDATLDQEQCMTPNQLEFFMKGQRRDDH